MQCGFVVGARTVATPAASQYSPRSAGKADPREIGRREAGGRLSGAAIKLVPYLVAAPDYSRTVYDRDFFSAAIL
jgi:hypothetical protein